MATRATTRVVEKLSSSTTSNSQLVCFSVMAYEEIFEPIEVITFFERGTLHPLRFKWKGNVYKIKRVNSAWSVQEGLGRQYHFSVTADTPDCFELIFDSADFNWQLARIYLEG